MMFLAVPNIGGCRIFKVKMFWNLGVCIPTGLNKLKLDRRTEVTCRMKPTQKHSSLIYNKLLGDIYPELYPRLRLSISDRFEKFFVSSRIGQEI